MCVFEASKGIRAGNDELEVQGTGRDLTPHQVSIEMLAAHEKEQTDPAALVHGEGALRTYIFEAALLGRRSGARRPTLRNPAPELPQRTGSSCRSGRYGGVLT